MFTSAEREVGYTKWVTVFHVTHERSVPAIYRMGLDPTLARRPAKRVWLCDLAMLPWAMRHVCATQGWLQSEIRAFRVTLPRDVLVRHREGVYYVHWRIPPKYLGALQGGI